jgi:soluble lytic murein transglycosylase-like protein
MLVSATIALIVAQAASAQAASGGTASRPEAASWSERIRQQMAQSLEQQRESVRKQWSSVHQTEAKDRDFYTTPWPPRMLPPPPEPAPSASLRCNPLPSPVLWPIIEDAAGENGLPTGLLDAVIRQESARYPCAVSSAGAMGLMQLMPETAAALGVKNPFDPEENVQGGARFLKRMLERFGGDLRLALGAYNAGPGAIEAYGGLPPYRETQDYVSRILGRFQSKPAMPTPVLPLDSP